MESIISNMPMEYEGDIQKPNQSKTMPNAKVTVAGESSIETSKSPNPEFRQIKVLNFMNMIPESYQPPKRVSTGAVNTRSKLPNYRYQNDMKDVKYIPVQGQKISQPKNTLASQSSIRTPS